MSLPPPRISDRVAVTSVDPVAAIDPAGRAQMAARVTDGTLIRVRPGTHSRLATTRGNIRPVNPSPRRIRQETPW